MLSWSHWNNISRISRMTISMDRNYMMPISIPPWTDFLCHRIFWPWSAI